MRWKRDRDDTEMEMVHALSRDGWRGEWRKWHNAVMSNGIMMLTELMGLLKVEMRSECWCGKGTVGGDQEREE